MTDYNGRWCHKTVRIKDIACGLGFSLALENNGQVRAAGLNYYGQLGTGDNTNYNYNDILNTPVFFIKKTV